MASFPSLIPRLAGLTALAVLPATAGPVTLEVGPGRAFGRIADANARAVPGTVIEVHPLPDGQPYRREAVLVTTRDLTIRAVPAAGEARVRIDGSGFDYSGAGRVPRAIFQFNPGADGGVLEGFELTGAHNGSHNGAGVRINQANRVTVRNCHVFGNDMGAMSNGDGGTAAASGQLFESCIFDHNGSLEEPGYNHNLYLGGTDVTLRFCEAYASLTGHNVKSRAHVTRLEYCYIHDSSNRELDLVDAPETARPDSHAVVLGCVITKARACTGNRAVIHFGQDGGREHDGTLFLIHDTIITPFAAPVVQLSAGKAGAQLIGNLFVGGTGHGQAVAGVIGTGALQNVQGRFNVFGRGFAEPPGTGLRALENVYGFEDAGLFGNPPAAGRFRPVRPVPSPEGIGRPESVAGPRLPGVGDQAPLWQYHHPAGGERRPEEPRGRTAGAYAAE